MCKQSNLNSLVVFKSDRSKVAVVEMFGLYATVWLLASSVFRDLSCLLFYCCVLVGPVCLVITSLDKRVLVWLLVSL